MHVSKSAQISALSMFAAASFLTSGCDGSTQANNSSLKDSDITKSSLPALTIDTAIPLNNGFYEVPAKSLKSWSLDFTDKNPDRIILWVAPSAEAVVTKNELSQMATATSHTTAFLVYTIERGTFSGIQQRAEK